MRTEELRSLLHDRGEQVHDAGTTARIGAVHERVRAVRRRRAAVAGGGLVAAVAAIALAVVPGTGVSPSPGPVAPANGGIHDDGRGGGYAAMPVGLPPTIDYRGETWVLDTFVQADPGARSAVLKVGRADQPVLVVEGHRGLPTPARFEVLLDGEYAGSLRLLPRDWVADMLEGDSAKPWTIVDPLEAGADRVARLEVIEGRTGRVRLALAEYVRVD